ncbi:unnamed protein product [Schistosoma curassoni]|uniref:Uncharacterized protein n=1 Tax=Schistosoma curassoni TaxID=6186 RepID=A0A183K308_9TREM|nr:unnamed protein product [Schistosoma curassoni]
MPNPPPLFGLGTGSSPRRYSRWSSTVWGRNMENYESQHSEDTDVKVRIGNATTAFLQLNNIWNSKQPSVNQYQTHNLQYERQHNRFYYTELKHGELLKPSSNMYMYL